MQSMTSRVGALVRALVLLALVAVVVPWALVWAARSRFGGPAPWSAIAPIGDWEADTIWSALTDRLSESTVADVVIRISLTVAWVAVVVLLATVVAELVHMLRHDGLALPDIRGLGTSQSVARIIAAGLLVVVPMLGSPSRAIANDAALRPPEGRSAATLDARPENAWLDEAPAPAGSDASALRRDALDDAPDAVDASGRPAAAPSDGSATQQAESQRYVVQPGDSVWSIATRMAGPDRGAVDAYADRLLELNLGRVMNDGQRFSNAALIDVGWVLALPSASIADPPDVEVVDAGETLWSIAEDRLGAGERWPEIFEANEGRTFDDGRTFTDPDLIHPGWELALGADPPTTDGGVAGPAVDADPADVADAVGATDGVAADRAGDVPDPGGPDDDGPSGRDGSVVLTGDPVPAGVDPAPPAATPSRPSNTWMDDPLEPAAPEADGDVAAVEVGSTGGVPSSGSTPEAAAVDGDEVELLTYERAAMLSVGVLTLLAVRRRDRMRRARPNTRLPEPPAHVVAAERALRGIEPGDRFARVDIAIRHAANPLIAHGARVGAVLVAADGDIELIATADAALPPPWSAAGNGSSTRWSLAAATPIELLVDDARRVGSPCPTLVQLGRDDREREVYVDLEALAAIEVGGPGEQADAIVSAVAATLAASVLAEVTTLVGVGIADEAFLGHRHHRAVRDVQRAFEAAADAIGSTARADESTFQLRARLTSGETWEPAVVLVGSAAGTITPPRDRTGMAVVSASPVHGPSSRLAPSGSSWTLLPMGIRLTPIGLTPDDVVAISDLTSVPDTVDDLHDSHAPGGSSASDPSDRGASVDPDVTLVGGELAAAVASGVVPDDVAEADGPAGGRPHELVVRLLGPVSVESADGRPVEFERSKTKELIAWLGTHRDRATRSNARAALWELDVRDATFANVVSEARRALARCVEPPEGEEWVARTMTDALPLHELVVTDADLLADALAAARLQPPDLAIATLTPAVERIVGMPFEGTSYLWPDAEGIASDLVLRALTACDALARHCLSIGDIDGVFAASGRGLQVLPAHEDMVAIRMQAHARLGDRAGMRHEWESYERAITADPWSDGEPSDRMLELRRDLMAG